MRFILLALGAVVLAGGFALVIGILFHQDMARKYQRDDIAEWKRGDRKGRQ